VHPATGDSRRDRCTMDGAGTVQDRVRLLAEPRVTVMGGARPAEPSHVKRFRGRFTPAGRRNSEVGLHITFADNRST
jgi:hypothetical protein